MRVVLISTYDLGRQPLGLAGPAACLRRAGFAVRLLDLAVSHLDPEAIAAADLIAFHVPMHTATRLALDLVPEVRDIRPAAHRCFFGLYATVAPERFRTAGVETMIAGEYEAGLLSLAERLRRGEAGHRDEEGGDHRVILDRQDFAVPERADLPPLDRYAKLRIDGEERLAGYTEASRGCKHLCRHCPVVPVYDGTVRFVAPEVVLADIRQQVAAGARHMTFGDPDFFNSPGHSLRIVDAMHDEFPDLTWDATIKVEHLIRHATHLRDLQRTGCLFVITAAESLDDRVLEILDKGHDRSDYGEALRLTSKFGVGLASTWIPFTPWTTLRGYLEFLEHLKDNNQVPWVSPVHLAIRLLIPPGSRLLACDEVRRLAGPFDPERLIHPWSNPDPRVDVLQRQVERVVEVETGKGRNRYDIFRVILQLAKWTARRDPEPEPALTRCHVEPSIPPRISVPYLTEPWYC